MSDGSEAQIWQRAHREGVFDDPSPDPALISFVPRLTQAGVRSVLDLGCGSGRHILYLDGQGFEPIGVDFAPAALEAARRNLSAAGVGASLVQADMRYLPLKAQSVDACISFNVIYHGELPTVRRALREVSRVLKPGGLARMNFLSDQHPRFGEGDPVAEKTYRLSRGRDAGAKHRFFSRPELEELLDDSRFFIREVDVLLRHAEDPGVVTHWLATFVKRDEQGLGRIVAVNSR